MMFGEASVSPLIKGDKMSVTVDEKIAWIDLNTRVSSFKINPIKYFET